MLWLGILALLAAGCAGMPPEQQAREAAMWEVAQRCQARFGSVASIDQIDGHGRLRYTCHGSCPERPILRFRYLSLSPPRRLPTSLQCHRDLVVALRRRDGATADRLVQQTTEAAGQALRDHLRSSMA